MRPSLQVVIKYLKILLLFFLIFQISRLYFLFYNSALLTQGFLSTWFQTVWHGLRLDFSACAYCVFPLLIIWLIEEIFKKRFLLLHKIILIFTIILIVAITMVDPELYQKWGNKFNSQVLVYISHPLEMALSAGETNWIKTLFFTIGLIYLILVIYKWILNVIKSQLAYKPINLLWITLLIAINFVILRGGIGVSTISQSSAIYSEKSINNAAATNSLWNALYFIMSNTNDIYSDNLFYLNENDAVLLFKEQLHSSADTTHLFTTKKPNIMVVILESFTASASQYFTGKNNCTPFLDSIARQNLSFMQCYASGDRTEKGLVSVLSGYPAQPSSSIIVFPDKVTKLPAISKSLKTQGYKNYYFYGGDAEFASMKAYLIVQQFDEIIDRQSFNAQELTSKWGAHDEHLYSKALNKLNSASQPFFATIMSLSSHEPYDVPYEDKTLAKDEWYGLKNSIEYADQCLFTFLENCKKQPWYKETVIVLVADHGHDIGLKDVHYFGPEKYHIPLIITGGALNNNYRGKQINHVVSQTIIPHLLLTQLGIPADDFQWQSSYADTAGFAQYHYSNGFGRVSKTQQCLFDNDSKKCYYYRGLKADSFQFINHAKAYQQELIKDFLSK